jgi:hypothetical protein
LSVPETVPQFLPSRRQKSVSVSLVQQPVCEALQIVGAAQVPQSTVRVAPQLSVAVTDPQDCPRRWQNAAFVSGVHPHTFVAPQVWGEVHVPQLETVREMPQLSAAVTVPQFFPSREQNCVFVSGVQQTCVGLAGACEHSYPVVQLLQVTAVPQLSSTVPHLPEHVVDIESRVHPQTFGVVAPHCCPEAVPQTAVPQVSVPPQPSLSVPQFDPVGQLVRRVQPQTPGVPGLPPPHVLGALQVPQLTTPLPPQPSGAVPQFWPVEQAWVGESGVQPQTFGIDGVWPPHV